ncbi:MAG TPA: thioredoxin domain-containing protein [Gemmatimonadaceae bacterium]|jgi:protein-disulfide isomerase|nr:thioredoxin domain-containing protein [Gemmatimonadaceae bacterium]
MANNNPRKSPPPAQASSSSRAIFYGALIAIAVIGAGAIFYLSKNTPAAQQSAAVYDALRQTYANAGAPQPYTIGNPKAPVVIEEFADFECPSCGRFSTITEPDIRKNIVNAGQAYYKYYDFPLPMHKNSQAASNAAACADEQGKFWEMHDQLFLSQDQWGLGPTEGEVVDDPKPIFLGFAKTIGLNMPQWEQCFDTKKHQSRINANAGEAVRRNVAETPTFYINGIKSAGALSYDKMKQLVDSAAKLGPPSATDSALNNIVKP